MPKIKSNKNKDKYDEGVYIANIDNSITLLALMAPWCGHCQALKPTWNKLMDEYEGKQVQNNAMIAALEEGQYEGKKGCGGVRGYPTIRLVKNGRFQKDYQGSREEAALKHFIETELGLKKKWKGGRKRKRRRRTRKKRRKSKKKRKRRTRRRRIK